MHRFFVDPGCIREGRAIVEGAVARQVSQVLRIRAGESIALMDGSGRGWVVLLSSVSPSRLEGDVVRESFLSGEPGVSVTLFQGILKGEKFEMVLQKGTELGISTFVPVECRRSIPRAAGGRADTRFRRWQSIVREAAEQSGRTRIPVVEAQVSLGDALGSARGVTLIAWEGERETGLREALAEGLERARVEGLGLLVGPEGGFDPAEVELAMEAGAAPVSLGRRTLRSETAGLAMTAAVMYEMGELGSPSGDAGGTRAGQTVLREQSGVLD